jgi:dTDP-glucose pyrophosphorylase
MNKIVINDIRIDYLISISDVFKFMSDIGRKLLLVFNGDKFEGIISVGDIQRAIINKVDLSEPIKNILRSNYKFAKDTHSIEEIKNLMFQYRMEFMPVLNSEGDLVDVIFWEDIISDKKHQCDTPFDLPIVIMAGGQGSRLRPLTNVLPKPLIPIGDKTMLEDIMDRFVACGSNKFFLSVNYKADFIKNYFTQLSSPSYKIEFFQEDKPLGTAGSLKLLRDKINSTFFVSNCDIIIDEDYSHILEYHKGNKNDITLVTAMKNYSIPYGIVETSDRGLLSEIKEKPNLSFQINTGLYILEPSVIDCIPDGDFFHITHLMEKIISNGGRVGCFPVSEKSWTDIGDWKEYQKFLK